MQQHHNPNKPVIQFNVHQNQLSNPFVDANGTVVTEGVRLSEEEQDYLLPHFLLLLVGKPGSGKSTVMKQLVVNPQMYKKKFDEILLVSPSYEKLGLNVRKERCQHAFSLDWIFEIFHQLNVRQYEKLEQNERNRDRYGSYGGYAGALLQKGATGAGLSAAVFRSNEMNKSLLPSNIIQGVQDKSRGTLYKPLRERLQTAASTRVKSKVKQQAVATAAAAMSSQELKDKFYAEYDKLSQKAKADLQVNVLLVLDDVVGSIKRSENDPRLAQLVMNRRHLICGGVVSIILVSQKYTLIPTRVRSNASWLILFKLNPVDFENVYHDAVTMPLDTWRQLLAYVFGEAIMASADSDDDESDDEDPNEEQKDQQVKGQDGGEIRFSKTKTIAKTPKKTQKAKTLHQKLAQRRRDNLGVWVEYNMYFMNFKLITAALGGMPTKS